MHAILYAAAVGRTPLRQTINEHWQSGGDGAAIVLLVVGIAALLVILFLMFTDFYKLRRFFARWRGRRG